jgi:AcrR family transcriptional regulator
MDAILDAAALAFREFGIEGATMEEIAARAQVARATLYYNFASKEEIAIALAERYRTKGYASLEERKASGASAEILLREFFAYAAQWTATDPEVAMVGTVAALRGVGRAPDRPPTTRVLRDLAALGQTQGLFRKDVDAQSLALILGSLLLQMALVGPRETEKRNAAWGNLMLDVVLDGMRAN